MSKIKRFAGRPRAGEKGLRVRDYDQVSIRVPPSLMRRLKEVDTKFDRLQIFTAGIESCEKKIRKKLISKKPRTES